ncbi:hypothetical protein [Butyrivibrio sp. NC2002]|uniref:hypothetical protein n=1 Tax=Butyrivibrio sp. NC2002 TaxID=1410610 RepID=UPI0005620FF0|nr:hypothetical protein [Butyrivibrio sp. NC2002]
MEKNRALIGALSFISAICILSGCSNRADEVMEKTDEAIKEAADILTEKHEELTVPIGESTGSESDNAVSEASDTELSDDSSDTVSVTDENTFEGQDDQTDSIDLSKYQEETTSLLTSKDDINLRDTDGKGTNYLFTYNEEDFKALYTTDNWKIFDSYKIEDENDIILICQALIDEHPVHGSDMVSFRQAQDMAEEWIIHNVAYEMLPDTSDFKSHAGDVDFDPKDQNKSLEEIYEDRTGKEFNLDEIMDSLLKNS